MATFCSLHVLSAVILMLQLVTMSHTHISPETINAAAALFPKIDATSKNCLNLPGLSGGQRAWCRSHSPFMHAVTEGARLGLQECGRQFEYNRWNCKINNSSAFGKVMRYESQETAFTQAIQSAGVTLTISRTCSKGNKAVDEFCACDTSYRTDTSNVGKWDWGGCGDNLEKGIYYSSQFLDMPHNSSYKTNSDAMELHNNKAGRLAVKETMTILCKCHGLTGACTIKICWKSLPKVQVVGKVLKQQYNEALRLNRQQGQVRAPSAPGGMPRAEFVHRLVHLNTPPDFCQVNHTIGTYGTARRVCHKDSHGDDGCDLLCCGNGRYVERTVVRRQCECRFVWCCKVQCSTCLYARRTYHCKDPTHNAVA